jgi:predicted XRE-type DNA-binding protein
VKITDTVTFMQAILVIFGLNARRILHFFQFFDNVLLIMLDPKEFGRRISQKRKELRWNQTQLASTIGCSQTAISDVEAGKMFKFGTETISEFFKFLDIPFDPASLETKSTLRRLAFCGTHDCPISIPFVVHGRIVVQPITQMHQGTQPPLCQWCGTRMLDGCSSPGCNVALVGGAVFCPGCGEPFVKVPPHIAQHPDPATYIDIQLKTRDRLLANRLSSID